MSTYEEEVRRRLLWNGHMPYKIEEWLKCDHKFDLEAYVMSVKLIPVMDKELLEPQEAIINEEVICRHCHIPKKEWYRVTSNLVSNDHKTI